MIRFLFFSGCSLTVWPQSYSLASIDREIEQIDSWKFSWLQNTQTLCSFFQFTNLRTTQLLLKTKMCTLCFFICPFSFCSIHWTSEETSALSSSLYMFSSLVFFFANSRIIHHHYVYSAHFCLTPENLKLRLERINIFRGVERERVRSKLVLIWTHEQLGLPTYVRPYSNESNSHSSIVWFVWLRIFTTSQKRSFFLLYE